MADLGGTIAPAPAVEPTPTPAEVKIEEHGELGPLLLDPKHDFTGPGDVK